MIQLNKKIYSAVIGLGVGMKHFDTIRKNKNCEIKIVCDKNIKILKKLKKKYKNIRFTSDDHEIFKDKEINLVSIASYDDDHFDQVMKSLKNNKNVIVEKPICLNYAELKKISEVLKKKKSLKLTSNLVLRTEPIFKEIKKTISKKNFGDISIIEADYIWARPWKLEGWRSGIKEYSIIHGAAIHMIDLVNWLLNKRPSEVIALGSKNINLKNYKKVSDCILLLKYNKNISVKISVIATSPYKHFHELKIFSNKHSLIHNIDKSKIMKGFEKKNKIINLKESYPQKKDRSFLINNFISSLLDRNQKHMINQNEVINSMCVALAAEKSLKNFKKVKVKYL